MEELVHTLSFSNIIWQVITPLIFSGLVIYIILSGNLNLSVRNVLMPIIGLVALICIYEGGKESKKKKTIKEMEKMKAKDILNK